MAKRPYFLPVPDGIGYIRREADFTWNAGMAMSQQQKNVCALHAAIAKQEDLDFRVLEVSSRSDAVLGIQLSALNLTLPVKALDRRCVSVENVFQCAKMFADETGTITEGPFPELLDSDTHGIKRAVRERLEAHEGAVFHLTGFAHNGRTYPLVPAEGFYFYIYAWALCRFFRTGNRDIFSYRAFTDISFNPKKSVNCQAAALAFYLSWLRCDAEGLVASLKAEDPKIFFDTLARRD